MLTLEPRQDCALKLYGNISGTVYQQFRKTCADQQNISALVTKSVTILNQTDSFCNYACSEWV